jgi:putative ABC transport system permease protein
VATDLLYLMNKHYLNVFFRNLLRRDTVTYINIIGLSVGLTCTLMILLWIGNELTYDKFHEHSEEIYRIQLSNFREGILTDRSPITSVPMAPEINANFPEIQSFVRLRHINSLMLQNAEEHLTIENCLAADSSFFQIFSFDLIHGNPKTALAGPNKIVLTESSSNLVFHGDYPVGKSLVVNGDEHFLVSGVVKDPPQNSHIKFNGLISINTLWQENPCMKWDCNFSFYSYLLLNKNTDVNALETKFPDFLWEPLNKKNAQAGWREEIHLIPIEHIHFQSTSAYELEPAGNIAMVYLFSSIAILILSVACINFINLTTAQASKKGKEIGIKKVIGATRKQLISQHLGEVFIQAFIALLIAVMLLEIALPSFSNLLQMKLMVNYHSFTFYISMVALLSVVTLATGSYSALYFSGISPVTILKNKIARSSKRSHLRNSLIVIQFAVSIALIACTFIIYNQLHFLTKHQLGFEKENIINIQLSNEEAQSKWQILKNEIANLSEVQSVGASTFVPGGGTTSNGYVPEGFESPMMLRIIDIDEDFLQTLGIEIAEGRNFSKDIPSDRKAFIINETLAKTLNWSDPIGKFIERNGTKHKVLGVVKDFNFASLHNEMEPLILSREPWEGLMDFTFLSVKIKAQEFQNSIQKLERIWKSQVSSLPFEFSFLEDRLNAQYQNEQRLGKAFIYFSGLAILISCMGLFGVVLFLTEQKTKEIGIRKALGGSSMHILLLLSRDLTKWILLSLIIAVPIVWMVMNKWLMNFAYAVKIDWWVFIFAGFIALLLSWITVSWHTIKASLRKPVDTLRYE